MSNPASNLDFALLQRSVTRHGGARNRITLLWLLGLLVFLAGAVVTLVLYLQRFEADEAARRRATDAQWLEQSLQFHFRRLEDDLLVLARAASARAQRRGSRLDTSDVQGGELWRTPGVVLSNGWIAAGALDDPAAGPPRWAQDRLAHPDNAQALNQMQTTTRGLRRAAYAGPMRSADGSSSDVVWLAVPFFDRGSFAGNYLAALALRPALAALVPPWFTAEHAVTLVDPDDALRLDDAIVSHVALNLPGTDWFLRLRQIAPSSPTVPRVFFGVALLCLAGMLVALYGLRRDAVKRSAIQSLLQAQVALRTAMENSVTIGLRAWDLQGRILYVNQAFCRMVGYLAPELIGTRMPFAYWPPDQHTQLARTHADIISRGTDGQGVEVQFQHRDGHLIDVLINEAPLTTAEGMQIGWMSSVLDISERKRAQQQAAAQQERLEASGRLVAVGEVASTLAHELNQPLGALASFANGLLNRLHAGSISPAETAPVVERMARLAERAGAIIRRVGDFARRRELTRQRVDLGGVVQRVLDGDRPENVALHWVAPTQPVWVDADALLLEHLVANLTDNAWHWATQGQASQGPQVSVRVTPDAATCMALLRVGDNGPGVPPEAADTIFRAFVSRKAGGMGMGLAICRSIVEAHHGAIQVTTDPLLGGALFEVKLPLAPIEYAPQAS